MTQEFITGNTPIESITLSNNTVYYKREDMNPTNSFKDRSLNFWMQELIRKGIKSFVISSSGNAAVSAAAIANIHNVKLEIFVSLEIPTYKMDRILRYQNKNVNIQAVKRPKSSAIQYANTNSAYNLRSSEDDLAIEGYKSISAEIIESELNPDAIFICCSSGTSTVGIHDGFNSFGKSCPQIHIVQTTKIHPFAKYFDENYEESEESLANAVSDRVGKRKNKVIELVKKTQGFGWVISDSELINIKSILVNKGLQLEGYSAYMSFAGYIKAIHSNKKFNRPLCILSGI